MPELDLPPGDYRERKPKGWRWKLPLGHDEGSRLPFIMLLVVGAILGFIYWHREEVTPDILFGVSAMFAFAGGIMFMLWQRD